MLSFKVIPLTRKQQFLVNLTKMISPEITKWSKGVGTLDLNSVHVASWIIVCLEISKSVYFHFTLQETVINTERQAKVSNI